MSTGTSMPEITTITQSDGQETGPDLRSWLATLESADQLRRITVPVDWDEEIGAITRANLSLGGPALLFENILGHENTRCTKLLTSALGSRRQVQLMLDRPRAPAIRTSCVTFERHSRIPSRRAWSIPVQSKRTSSKATTSICTSCRFRSGTVGTVVVTSIPSVGWSLKTR